MTILRRGVVTEKWQLEPNQDPLKWDGKTWVLVKDWHISVKADTYGFDLVLKAGFSTDGGSIPKVAQNIYNPVDEFMIGYLPHDGMYASETPEDRIIADNVLFDLIEFRGMSWAARQTVYASVRVGGAFVWAGHKPKQVKLAKTLVEFIPHTKSLFNKSLKIPHEELAAAARSLGFGAIPNTL